MKQIKIIVLVLTMFLLILISCKKEWLNPDPLSFYAPENVYINEAGFESGLVICKKEMNAENHGDRQKHFIACETMYSDLACSIEQCDFTKNTPSLVGSRSALQNEFLDPYVFIKNANTIISRIDDIKWTDQNVRNRILSEAYWFRAYWYNRLVNTYGDIPWVGQELNNVKLDYQSASRWAILAKIQNDLEYAVEWLPEIPVNLGDVSKGAANHLLAKVYLANCEFDKAIAATTNVINGPYSLMTSRFGIDVGKTYHDVMWDLHRTENKNLAANTETIYATVDRSNQAPATWWDLIGTYSMRHFTPSYWRVRDSKGARANNWTSKSADTLGAGDAASRSNNFFIYRIWEDATYKWNTTPDMRRANNNWIEMGDSISEIITTLATSPNFGEPLKKKYISPSDTIENWYSWPYYKTYTPTPQTPYYDQPMGGQGDMYIFRLAETYLLRAEAYYWKGQNGPAADDINTVRQRAHASLITAADVNIDYIFDERARELYMEEPRHSEMVRVSFIFGKLNIGGYSLSTITDKNWYHDRVMRVNSFYSSPKFTHFGYTATLLPQNILWPIPQRVITSNTLGRINQNIGYDGAELNVAPLEIIP